MLRELKAFIAAAMCSTWRLRSSSARPSRPSPPALPTTSSCRSSGGSSAGSTSPIIFVFLGTIPDGFKGDPNSYADLKKAGVAVLGWGQFVTVAINFLILAFVIFLLVRWANRIMRREDPLAGPSEVDLLTEIMDELKKR